MKKSFIYLGELSIQFIFADTPISGGVWWADPPGGKDEPTTDPEHANISISYLDQFVKEQGPFYGIIGYSQGGAMAALYISERPSYFQKAIIFCGGLGTRLGIETKRIPKPMVKIQGIPILERIINLFRKFGVKNFILSN